MKKRKLRGYVLPGIYFICLCVLAIGITFFSKSLMDQNMEPTNEHYNYSMSVFDEEEKEDDVPTVEEVKVSKPFTSDKVTVEKSFYKEEDTPENQENALIYYQNTYMQNTGILYASDEVFDVTAVLDGTIKEIKKDEILGTVLTLETDKKVTCIYYTLGDVKVKENDVVKQNDIIATSGQSQIETTKQTLLFEVYMDGVLTNPNTLFEKNISELN